MNLVSRPYLVTSFLFWIASGIFGVYFLLNIKKFVNLGIDLQGGTYLTLSVKYQEAFKEELLSIIDDIKQNLKNKSLILPLQSKLNKDNSEILLEFDDQKNSKAALDMIKAESNSKYYKLGQDIIVKQDGNFLNISLSSSFAKQIRENAIESDISVIRTRLDASGLGEISILPQGYNDIVVELPIADNPEKIKERIGKSAVLEIKPVFEYAYKREELLKKLNNNIPADTMIVKSNTGKEDETEMTEYYLVPINASLTGKLLKNVSYNYYMNSNIFEAKSKGTGHQVNLVFNSQGAAKFYDLTSKYLGERVAIIIDDLVVSAPKVSNVIDSGNASISGNFTEESAKELVSLLKSGSFSAPVEFIEERQIGPSLGQESIEKGLISCIIGLGLLFLFSIAIYKLAGLFALIVLLYNLLFILFGLAYLPDATLTLPGIAGMVLTLGMAIDSSILIYEKIKEDLSSGIQLAQAVNNGFSGATTVILDANITTFLVGAVLYYFGSPAIQGFALTMMIGIISTLLTGLILLKTIFNFFIYILNFKKISF